MSTCKFDSESGKYLTADREECRYDEDGFRTYHCQARRTCSIHVGRDEKSCLRCVSRVSQDVRAIVDLAPLAIYEALVDGVASEAANLAGPATDVREWSQRRVAMKTHLVAWEASGRISERQYLHARSTMEDDDDLHPVNLLNRWHMMLAEDYSDALPREMTLLTASDYLLKNMQRIAQDPEQDFPYFRRQMRDCRSHLEANLHNAAADPGVACPTCVQSGKVNPKHVKLRREFGRWVYEGEEKGWLLKYSSTPRPDDEAAPQDRWVCPRKREHVWSEAAYRAYVEERSA